MTIRLNKVTRDLNVGLSTVVEFLQKKGYDIESNPNTKITEEEYELLVKEYSTDKTLRMESDRFTHQRQTKERKSSVSIEGYKPEKENKEKKEKKENVIKAVVPSDARPHFKSVGKIDLNNLSKGIVSNQEATSPEPKTGTKDVSKATKQISNDVAEQEKKKEDVIANTTPDNSAVKIKSMEEKPQKLKASPVKEVEKADNNQPNPVEQTGNSEQPMGNSQNVITKENKKEEMKAVDVQQEKDKEQVDKDVPDKEEQNKEDSIYTIHTNTAKPKLNIVGQIDLTLLNQSTRPKKKTKEEKRKEREEKEKLRQDQKKQMKEAIIKEIRKDDPKGNRPQGNDTANGNPNNRKRRNRINNEKVDINKVSASGNNQRGGNNDRNGSNGGQKNNNNRNGQDGRRNNSQDARRRGDRFKKQTPKEAISEEDVAKQVKETLARLTNKGKNKGAKYRKEKREQASSRQQEIEKEEKKESKVLKLTEFVTANELATMMDISVNQVISTCMSIGMMVSINQRLDAETINLVAEEFGYKTEYVSAEVAQAIVEEEDNEKDLVPRPPIVTVMGHVDHGKTSLLDYIRKANVIAGEAGGITQHIGAYNVKLSDGRRITFLDTPGHEAFTAMRARGAKVTDIAIIIVAADDHVMPQTKEAINHAMAAGVPIVFAINKIDKPGANPDKIKEELASMNYLVEEWGGKYQSQDISAKKGVGVKELMEKVLLEADILDLKANPNRRATGSIIESSLDKGRGFVATVLVSNGTLKIGDIVLAGTSYGRVKAMFNERNKRLEQAGPSEPALLLGLNGAPQAGDTFHVMESDQEAREVANKREQLQREQGLRTQKLLTLDELGRRIALGTFKELNIVLKGDVDGSIEALKDSLIKLSTEQIQVNVIHGAVGQISESDVTLAAASEAIIIGFQVRPSAAARKLADQDGVDIRLYSVIYDAIEEVKDAMEGMLEPQVKEVVTASVEVRQVFHITKVGTVAGAMVKEGKVKRSDKARVVREGIVVFNGAINALKRFKDDVKDVGANFECGISLVNYNDLRPGDILETYEEVEVKQKL
jgi:translation initiation factor IF-2